MSALPLFLAPGGLELAVVALILFLLFGVPLTLILVLGYRFVAGQADVAETDERIEDLEAEVADLRERLEDETESGPNGEIETAADATASDPEAGER
ncbi:MAG: preprotein translocase subunit TatA [Halanaeroarchaeum sp.]